MLVPGMSIVATIDGPINVLGDGSMIVSGTIEIGTMPSVSISTMPTVTVNDTTCIDTAVSMNQVNVAASSVTVIAANASRKWFTLRNQHLSGDVYFYFGATATLTNSRLLQNGEEFNMGLDDKYVYRGIITAISANATSKPLSFMEGT